MRTTMRSFLSLLCVIVFFSQQCQGIQLTLNLISAQGSRPSCGVLTCLERSHDSDSTTTTDISQHLDSTDSSSPVRNVTKMALYKTNELGDQDLVGRSSKAKLVAFVDSQHTTVTRVANAIKVEGKLGGPMTSLRLELFKQEDCRAQFTCEVLAVDGTGRELVKTSHLLQQPSAPASVAGGTGGESWTPAMAMHLVNLAMELNLNVELMKSVMEGYSDRMKDVESKVETLGNDLTSKVIAQEKEVGDKLGLVEKELRNKLDLFEVRLTDKFASVDKKVYKLTLSNENIDDKLDSSTKRLEDRLIHQDDKLSMSMVKLQDTVGEIEKVQSSFTSFVQNLKEELKETIDNVHNDNLYSLELNATKLSTDLQVFKTSTESQMQQNFESLKTQIGKQGSILTNNLNKALEEAALNISMDIAAKVIHNYHMLDDNIEEIVSNINKSTTETHLLVRNTLLSLNVTDASEVASIVTDVLTPKTCRKGMISLLTQPSYPYPVVQPSLDADITVPYLCDTVTGRGGWIVIQRRTTGNVDFYRTWADYKRGFGTLDDDFWLGNDNIHALTSRGEYELRVELRYNGKSSYAHYGTFAISGEIENYTLTVGSYEGTAGNALAGHSGHPFTTRDRDNDNYGANCAVTFTGAWWYAACHSSNLNGKWNQGSNTGPRWSSFSGDNAVSFSEMKIRKLD